MIRRWLKQNLESEIQRRVIDSFHRAWYDSPETWKTSSWGGFGLKQLPFDLQTYQSILFDVRPAFVVQTGVSMGGSMAFFAHLLDAIGAPPESVVVGVDIALTPSARKLSHPRIRLIEASSTDPATLERVRSELPAGRRGLVSLDSDHSRDHVLREMQLYAPLVEVGSYMVVEDTNVNGHPVFPEHGPGPYEAVDAFMATSGGEFVHDERWKKMLFSFHHHGWLRRVR